MNRRRIPLFDTAAHLVDRVIPRVAMRQWVLTFSRQVRYHVAADPKIAAEVITRALRTLFSWQRRHAREAGKHPCRANSCGAITFVQRFNSALELSYHLHILIPDGLFVADGEAPEAPPRFVELAPPTDAEVEQLLGKIITKVERQLRKRGRLEEEEANPERNLELFASQPVPRTGRRFGECAPPPPPPPPPQCARRAGYSLHAGTWLRANDREGLERLCRYGLRPPLSLGRLDVQADGSYTYRMKRRFSDGRQVLHFSAEALLLRLCALIPPPRVHLVRYAGIFAPNARGRAALTAQHKRDTNRAEPEPCEPPRAALTTGAELPTLAALCKVPPRDDPTRSRRLAWATLLRRTFQFEVLVCPRCAGPMRLIRVIEDPSVIRTILAHLGLRTAPARAGPRAAVAMPRLAWISTEVN